MINVLDLGASGDGIADDTTPIQKALILAQGKTAVFVPAGTYKITKTLMHLATADHTDGPTLIGEGRFATLFDNQVVDSPMLRIGPSGTQQFQRGGALRDFSIITTTKPLSSHGIQIQAAYQLRLDNVRVHGLSGDGIRLAIEQGDADGHNELLMERLWLSSNGGYGINVTGPAIEGSFLRLCNCFVTLNAAGGMSWKGLICEVVNSAFTLNTGAGGFVARYDGTHNRHLYLRNVDFEHNSPRQLNISGTVNVVGESVEFLATNPDSPQSEGVTLGGGGGAVVHAVFRNSFVRVAPFHAPHVMWKIDPSVQWSRIERTRWDGGYDQAGHTRFVDFGLQTEILDDGFEWPHSDEVNSPILPAQSTYTPDAKRYQVHFLNLTEPGPYTIAPPLLGGPGSQSVEFIMRNSSAINIQVHWNPFYLLSDNLQEMELMPSRQKALRFRRIAAIGWVPMSVFRFLCDSTVRLWARAEQMCSSVRRCRGVKK